MESTKHGAAAGDAKPPVSGNWTIDQEWESYSAEEHAVWKTLYERQSKLLPGRACDEFVQGMRDLAMDGDRIPDFRRLSEVLEKRTGWSVVAVPGLVPDEVFFDHLANRRFPAGQFIRRPDQLDYLEEPDVFHDVFGHVPMLVHPVFADYMEAYGKGGLRARSLGVLAHLARVYWYTVEFGLIGSGDGLRIYGSGIASSYTETIFALEDPSPNRIRFDLERVMRTLYRIDDFQETYFVIESFDELLALAEIDFGPIYRRVAALPELEPGTIDPGDGLLHRGTGIYHAGRRRVA
ncbi:phenylalanine 4-monooxygenase [Skermanella sp. TT6]|uniref:Phenylalanine-4-hydroxylase n=1 Tax=Skermanella cutis TaxID=2775420 RepID=A0ABX7BD76_9PROT|nr:phenylalanine 4-monooxygenase [Skermanella sp. TT6]QQP92048.1 phenylalanine 4-monooxygenase [Skermanella sp. TT6]